MHAYITMILCTTNLTDIFIDLFGWDSMQSLWGPLSALFDMLEGLWGIDLGPLWDVLFT